MSTQIISQRYARGLMNLAGKGKDTEAVAKALEEAVQAIGGPELGLFLGSETALHSDKEAVLKSVLAKLGGPKVLTPFILLLHQKRRLALLPEISELFQRLADARLGRAQAEVTVAEPLSAALQERLRKQIERATGKTITLKVLVDPEVLGGAVTRVGSSVWDGSVRHHLDQVREQLLRG